jgi:hypothetical protein
MAGAAPTSGCGRKSGSISASFNATNMERNAAHRRLFCIDGVAAAECDSACGNPKERISTQTWHLIS